MRHLDVLCSPVTRGASVSSGIVLSIDAMKTSHRVMVCKSMRKFAWYLTLFLATIATAESELSRHEQTPINVWLPSRLLCDAFSVLIFRTPPSWKIRPKHTSRQQMSRQKCHPRTSAVTTKARAPLPVTFVRFEFGPVGTWESQGIDVRFRHILFLDQEKGDVIMDLRVGQHSSYGIHIVHVHSLLSRGPFPVSMFREMCC